MSSNFFVESQKQLIEKSWSKCGNFICIK